MHIYLLRQIYLGEQSSLVCKAAEMHLPAVPDRPSEDALGKLDKMQLHVLLTGALSSDEFCWSNSLARPLLDLPYCS